MEENVNLHKEEPIEFVQRSIAQFALMKSFTVLLQILFQKKLIQMIVKLAKIFMFKIGKMVNVKKKV